jgi:hypothetical protein
VKLREHMIGLPLQRSIFDRLDASGTLIGLENTLQNGRFNASLDTEGSLHVDQADVAALVSAFPKRPDEAFLIRLETERRTRCAALLHATTRAQEAAAIADIANGRLAANELLDRLTDFVPYPILTKIVPDLLREALVAQGEPEIPSAPTPSPGMSLTRDLERLSLWVLQQGSSAAALADAWPDVPQEVKDATRGFCTTHTGFGPVAWEAPGFDSACYTLLAMTSLGRVDGPSDVARRPSFSHISPEIDRPPMTLAGVLEGWLELTDLQIWFVRTAFYVGLVPLIVQLSAGFGMAPEHLLFVTRHELKDSVPTKTVISERMATYQAGDAYLTRNSVGPERLGSLFEEAACPSR